MAAVDEQDKPHVLNLSTVDTPAYRARAFVFEDPASLALLRRVRQVAPSLATVLLQGETGTGKEVVARHVHELSQRRDAPFVGVNCGALTESLVESELFGHERGAFTGATSSKMGWFEAARGGTLFLDEIGELTLGAQVKLLRVLQEAEVVRLGSRAAIAVDVRLVAATNVPLESAVSAGRFRADLYYRLNVAPLRLPPLRERPGDVLPLAQHFLRAYQERLGLGPTQLAADAIERLLTHHWPGNIRELENVIHRALLIGQGQRISRADLLLPENELADNRTTAAHLPDAALPHEDAFEQVLNALFEHGGPNLYQWIEERAIRAAHRYCDRNQLKTARLLSLSRNIVRARLMQYGELPNSLPPPSSLPPSSPTEA